MTQELKNIKEILAGLIHEALVSYSKKQGVEIPDVSIIIERPKNKEFGDFATNAAMQTARHFKKNPYEIAEGLMSLIPSNPYIHEVTAIKPGFINFRLNPAAGSLILENILALGKNYGRLNIGKGKKVLIEFMSANPTGPLHIGHARNAILGDSIARVLEAAGYKVTREYYYNDAGVQMKKLGLSLKVRYLQALGKDVPFPADGYQGGYIKEIANKLVSERGEDLIPETDIQTFTQFAADRIIKLIDADMKTLGIHFDNWFSEASLHKNGKVDATMEYLKDKGMLYEKEGAWWLRSAKFGDEKDRVVVKSDGEKTYLAPDIAYHKDKIDRGFDLLINIFGGDHHGYVPRLMAGVQALGYDPERLRCIVFQMVTLLKDGEQIKLSTRSGKFITLREVIEELGVDVVRYFFLMRSADSQMVFDWQLAKDHSMNNPVFYVQYAHARCCSLFKKADELGITWAGPEKCDTSLLTLKDEQQVIKELERLPEVVKLSAETFEPHHITVYLSELAGAFHALFTSGTKDETKRFLRPDEPDLTQARLTLVAALRQTLANTLTIIGITPMERM